MGQVNTKFYGVHVEFGNARLTLYRIRSARETTAKLKNDGVLRLKHSHSYFECHLFISGQGGLSVGGEEVIFREGEMLILPPGGEHFPLAMGDGKEIVFALTLEELDKPGKYYRYFRESLESCSSEAWKLPEALVEQMTEFYHRFEDNTLRMRCLQQAEAYSIVYRIFSCINDFDVDMTVSAAVEDENSDVTLDFLVNDLRVSMQDLSQQLGYTPRHVARLIRRKYGMSLREVRQKRMISTAKELLLRSPMLSIEEIATMSGFSSTHAMYACFEKALGMTPAEFRREHSISSN